MRVDIVSESSSREQSGESEASEIKKSPWSLDYNNKTILHHLLLVWGMPIPDTLCPTEITLYQIHWTTAALSCSGYLLCTSTKVPCMLRSVNIFLHGSSLQHFTCFFGFFLWCCDKKLSSKGKWCTITDEHIYFMFAYAAIEPITVIYV